VVEQFVRLNHRVVGAIWKDDIGKSIVTITNLITGEDFIDEAEILINCGGFLK
jgi:L-2-hydroxyglutarate oxidase LhgO